MLIKLQRSRNCTSYLIIENARNVSYSDKPTTLFDPKAVTDHIKWFTGNSKSKKSYSLYDGVPECASLKDGFQLNNIFFMYEDGSTEEIIFDGEAYICNDDGKTIHRIKRGGPIGFIKEIPVRKD